MDIQSDDTLMEIKAKVDEIYALPDVDCISIKKAAQILRMDVDDLIHEGVDGNIDIMAPVLFAGSYEWLVGAERGFYPELEEPVRVYFDASARVALSVEDVLKIEAVGWAVPSSFYALHIAERMDRLLRLAIPESAEKFEPRNAITQCHKREDIELFSVTYFPAKLAPPNEVQDVKRRLAYRLGSWHSIEPLPSDAERTTKDHLFVSKDDISKLLASKKEETPHGNTLRNDQIRLDILKAAIFCQEKWPEKCKGYKAWAEEILRKSDWFWADGKPPRKVEVMADLLKIALGRGTDPKKSKS